MKNLIIALFVFTCMSLQAQKKIEKSIPYNNEAVEVVFPLASEIEIVTWDRPEIEVRAAIETEDPGKAEKIDVGIEKDGSGIRISTNSKEVFRVDEKDRLVMNNEDDFQLDYVVYVPEGVQLELSSILGNLTSEFLKGDISVDLVVGNIDVRKFEGDLKLKTVTGEIILPANDTSFEAKTVMGEIYANADPDLEEKDLFMGQEMSLTSKRSKNRLVLETVTGDIHLQ